MSVLSLLVRNETWKQIVLKNAFWAGLAEGIVRILKIVAVLILVRHFGPAEYGKFAFAFSFASLFAVLFDSGLVLTATREFAKNRDNEQFLPDIVLIKSVVGLVGMAVICVGMTLVTPDSEIRAMILVLGISLLAGDFLGVFFALFRARQRMEYEFVARGAQCLLLFGGVMAVVWAAGSLMHIAWIYLISSAVTVGALFVVLWRKAGPLQFRFRFDVWHRLLRMAIPLALAGGLSGICLNTDSVILGSSGRMTETGWYNAAGKINAFALLPMSLLSLVALPAFSSTLGHLDEAFRRRWNAWTVGMVALGFYFVAVILSAAEQIVEVAFGPAFREAAATVRILAISSGLVYLYAPWLQALIMFDQQKKLLWSLLSGAIVNVVLNLLLIPSYGIQGAAWATVITHLGILCALLVYTAKCTPLAPLNRVLAGSLLGGILCGTLSYFAMCIATPNLWISLMIGTGVFVLSASGLLRGWNLLIANRRLLGSQVGEAVPPN